VAELELLFNKPASEGMGEIGTVGDLKSQNFDIGNCLQYDTILRIAVFISYQRYQDLEWYLFISS
jgi:hypothetical protein